MQHLIILLDPTHPGSFTVQGYTFTNKPILALVQHGDQPIRMSSLMHDPTVARLHDMGVKPTVLREPCESGAEFHALNLNLAISEIGGAKRVCALAQDSYDDEDADDWEWGPGPEVREDSQASGELDDDFMLDISESESGGVKHLIKPVPAQSTDPVYPRTKPKKRPVAPIFNEENYALRALQATQQGLEIDPQDQARLDAEQRAELAESRVLMLESTLSNRNGVIDANSQELTTPKQSVSSYSTPIGAQTGTGTPTQSDKELSDLFGDIGAAGVGVTAEGEKHRNPVQSQNSTTIGVGIDPFADWIDVVHADGTGSESQLSTEPIPVLEKNKGGRPKKAGSTAAKQRDSARRRHEQDKLLGVGHQHRKAPELESDMQELSEAEVQELHKPKVKKKVVKARAKAKTQDAVDRKKAKEELAASVLDSLKQAAKAGEIRTSQRKLGREIERKTGVLVTRGKLARVIVDERAQKIAKARRQNPGMVKQADEKRRESRTVNSMLAIKGKKKPVRVVDSPYLV
ncbi:hypothetical protein H1O16_gp321 [Burkholderia phage BcepSaruman]|uniref:Uncharacterized protein n=1 Tax=Burkholderia phage BcepSaruman TaxID=2530032 RepID=A0A4D5ZCP9_9CAUD|nr:hypothetical protein H1O16_gp321 [Burkholderia phage BcepSaruman]QBX06734.1 hypothetical protein BcepSaruman_321 [Burkholderia phage BcepSaruman]